MIGVKNAKSVGIAGAATAKKKIIVAAAVKVTVTGARTAKDVPIPAATLAAVSIAVRAVRVTVTGVMTASNAVTATNAARGK